MIKMVLVDMEQNFIDSEIMTDNLILSQEGRPMLMVSDYFLYLTAHISIITTVLIELQ
jgi:hypothetical protein